MVSWSTHIKYRYLSFQLSQHNTRQEKARKVLIDQGKGM